MVVTLARLGDGVPFFRAGAGLGEGAAKAAASSWTASPAGASDGGPSETLGIDTTPPHSGHRAFRPPAVSGAWMVREHRGHVAVIGMQTAPTPNNGILHRKDWESKKKP
jgi:hypothetical protein